MKKIEWEPVPAFVGWNKIKTLRKNLGLSQLQVAAGARISIACLWYIESGLESKATQKTKRKLAKYFDVAINNIFPCEMIGNEPQEKYLEKIKKGAGQPTIK